jgi:hypothetical protein
VLLASVEDSQGVGVIVVEEDDESHGVVLGAASPRPESVVESVTVTGTGTV